MEPDAPVVVTSVFPLQNDEVSLESGVVRGSSSKSLPGAARGSSSGRARAARESSRDDLPPWLQLPAERARRDREHALGESHFPSLGEGAALHQRSLLVSKTVSGFARYPERRPAGVVLAADGSLDVDHL